jgi:murein DD-endopeptidase MepM/ murein hydrolase activator NlpD
MRPELPRSVRYGRLIRRETTAVLSIWLTLPNGVRLPRSLRHELHTAIAAAGPVAERSVSIRNAEPLVLGSPFRRGLWLAHNGPGDHRAAHWGSMLVSGRKITVPQRYAIDFMGLEENGRGIRGAIEGSSNTDWPGFGADVVAVADSLVRDARNGIADNPPLFEPPPPSDVELSAAGGNYVVLDVGRSRFIHYAHLKQGSVTVRAGQRVRRGQLLGRVGNSGNTNGAHLHFNVVNGLRLREAEGLPYVFNAFVLRGATTGDSAFSDAPIPPTTSQNVRDTLPLNGAMVEFGRD